MKTIEFQSILINWIRENGEILVNIQLLHSGGSGSFYILKSAEQVEGLIKFAITQTNLYGDGRAIITGFRSDYYPLRGTLDEALIEKIRSAWSGKGWYSIVSLEDNFPEILSCIGIGNTQEEFNKDLVGLLEEWKNHYIGFGENPFDSDDWAIRNQVDSIQMEVGELKIS